MAKFQGSFSYTLLSQLKITALQFITVVCYAKSKDQTYLDYTSLHRQELSLVFARIKYKETYGVTTTFKYNNDCDNATGTEFAFCYAREN